MSMAKCSLVFDSKCIFYYIEDHRLFNCNLEPRVIIFIVLAFQHSSLMKEGRHALKSTFEFSFLYEQNLVLCV